MPTPAQIRVIHSARRAVGHNDEQYRTLLRNAGGAESAKELDNFGVENVMAVYEDLGFDGHPGGKTYWRDKVRRRGTACGERMAHKIRELAAGQRYTLAGLCFRFSAGRTPEVEQLLPREAWGLIEMLKAAAARAAN